MRAIDADAIAYESIDSCDTGRHEHYYGTGIIAVRKEDIDAMPTIQPEPHWIPVTERLPKDGRQVLVYAMSVHYALAKYDEMRDADGTYKKQWVTFDAWKPYYTIKDVIAWMPLPEPYKGVTT